MLLAGSVSTASTLALLHSSFGNKETAIFGRLQASQVGPFSLHGCMERREQSAALNDWSSLSLPKSDRTSTTAESTMDWSVAMPLEPH
eukprot:3789912-Amphidinium_carterae.2